MASQASPSDCYACRHSIGVRHQLQDGRWTSYRLYCKLWEGEVYTGCPEFSYEPGTDVQELGVKHGLHQTHPA